MGITREAFHPNGHLDILRTPIDWRDFRDESPSVTNQKIRRAKELGVVAVLFNASQVRDRVDALATLESRTLHPGKNVYVGLQGGAMPFIGQFFPLLRVKDPAIHPFVKYMEVSRYKDGQTGASSLEIVKDINYKVLATADTVTIIDEVGDQGDTVEKVRQHLVDTHTELTGRTDLKTRLILLSDKGVATFPGFEHSEVHRGAIVPVPWIAGMGMDGKEEWHRWDPEISLSVVQEEKYRDMMPEILDTLGERVVLGMSDITWVPTSA